MKDKGFESTIVRRKPLCSGVFEMELSRPPDFSFRGIYDFYLCGRKEMVRDVTPLVDERFPRSYLFSEIFF